MPKQVLMPQLGESVTEGLLTRWLKESGDPVKEFEALLEINTDKVETEIPSPAAGVLLKILVPAGTVVQVGEALALIGDLDEIVGEPQSTEGELVSTKSAIRTPGLAEAAAGETALNEVWRAQFGERQ